MTKGVKQVNRAIIIAIVALGILVLATASAMAAPRHNVKYVKIGITDDGRPVYVAIIQMNYMSAEVAARLFGGTSVSSQSGALARPPVTHGYNGDRGDTYRNNSYNRPTRTYTTPYSQNYTPYSQNYTPDYSPSN